MPTRSNVTAARRHPGWFAWLRIVGAMGGLYLTGSGPVQAQLTLTSPHARIVYQRNAQNQAAVPVMGAAPTNATQIDARLIPLVAGQGTATRWQPLSLTVGSGTFRGLVTATGGWYQLQIRAKAGATIVAQTTLNRVGVGEVFIVAGQSNALGTSEISNDAADDRVSCVDSRQDDAEEPMLPLLFSHVSAGTMIGPANPPHIWATLGDRLAARLNVPVLFFGAAQAGTSSTLWRQTAEGTGSAGLSPYRRIGVALLHYAARTGLRAVLWHQGEADNSTGSTTGQYLDNVWTVIRKSREQAGGYALPWVVSRVSYINGTTASAVVQAQNELISNDAAYPAVFAGPDTDPYVDPSVRPDGLHFSGPQGMALFTNLWDQSLTNDFFRDAVPFLPAEPALLTTGYSLPLTRRAGETVLVPFVSDLTTPTVQVQLLRGSDGSVIAQSNPTTQNPVPLTLPSNLPDGVYRTRVMALNPALTGTTGEPFTVSASAPAWTNSPADGPFVVGGTPDPALERIGYKYDRPTHGFNALVRAAVPVEIRLQRIDGGSFGETNWAAPTPTTDFPDFTYTRYYAPIALATGGVEPGRYRLSVRRQGDAGNGLWIDVTFLDKRHTLYIGPEPAPTPPPVPADAVADLSLTMRVDSRTPTVGQPVWYTLQLTNHGPDDATDVRVEDRLPANLAFVDSPQSEVSLANNIVTIAAGTVASGQTITYRFRATPAVAGAFVNAAQIVTVAADDPDSRPNSGTADGEDDAGQVDLRTRDGSLATGPLISSPNPNQTPLPSVESNQPPVASTQADLSLALSTDRLVMPTGQTASIGVRVSNQGGLAISSATVQVELPPDWQLTNTVGLTVSGQTVTAPLETIPAGSWALLTLPVRVNRSGTLRAQVGQATVTDPDSTPGNGYQNGEDDEASLSIRSLP